MYKVYAAETSNRIMATLGLASSGTAKNAKTSNETVMGSSNDDSEIQPYIDIPSISNGTLSFLLPSKTGAPTFVRYIINHKLMVFHHLFIGSYGLVVIAVSNANQKYSLEMLVFHSFSFAYSIFEADWVTACSVLCI